MSSEDKRLNIIRALQGRTEVLHSELELYVGVPSLIRHTTRILKLLGELEELN